MTIVAMPWEESEDVVVEDAGFDTMRAPMMNMQIAPNVPPARKRVRRPSLSMRTVSQRIVMMHFTTPKRPVMRSTVLMEVTPMVSKMVGE